MRLINIPTILILAAIVLVVFSGCIEEKSASFASTTTSTDTNIDSSENGNDDVFASTTSPTDTSIPTSSPLTSLHSKDHVRANGMIISIPLESDLKSYMSNQGIPLPVDVYAYLFYKMDGLYLIVTDNTNVDKEITSADVIGTLYSIDFSVPNVPDKLRSLQLKGVIVAESVRLSQPVQTTVKEINANPSNYAFKRVKIQGIYLVTSYKIGYAEYGIQKHLGNGILADEFPSDDQSKVIETLDPVHTTWQVRQGGVIATVLYPTDEILDQFDYASPQGIDEVKNELIPALLVEKIEHKAIPNVSIQKLTGNPYQYDGDVVKITGYALGENVPVKEILKQVDQNMKYIPVDVNILGVGIADGLNIGSQITLAGLNSELISETEMIMGRYEFEVAVTIQNVNVQNVLMLFLIEKKELPFEMPKNNTVVPTPTLTPTPKSGLLYVASSPSGASVYIDGTYKEKTVAGSYQPFYVDAGSHTIKLTMSGYEEYSMTEYVSSSQTKYIYPSLTGVTPTPTPTPASGLLYVVSYPSGASVYIDGTYEGKTVTGSYQPFYVDTGSHTIKLTMSGYEQYSTTEYVSSGQTKYLYPTLTEIDVTPTPTYTPQNKPPTADILLTRVCTGDETADAKRKMGIFCLGDGVGVDCTQSDDPDGYLVYYHWDWGDGDFDDQLTKPYHIYQETGVYLISLTVTDNWGITNTATKEVEVISFEEFFDISPSTPTPTPTPDAGTIWVYSDPAGGSVYVDGNYEGTTKSAGSISISTTTGYHTVEVLKDGYEAYSTSVYVYSGDNECATAYLTAITS